MLKAQNHTNLKMHKIKIDLKYEYFLFSLIIHFHSRFPPLGKSD